ncbi:hypothetical protein C1X64_19335 [Pseudomonas sp. GW456-E7]|nr:hypothetical protein C1X64_19335 [Pseudomonas sp. GW456-E7]
MAGWRILLVVYIPISAVTAAYGSAFTAGNLEERNAARPVGASLLAMEVNDDAGSLTPRCSQVFRRNAAIHARTRSTAKARRPTGRPGSEACVFPCRSCRRLRSFDFDFAIWRLLKIKIKRSQPSAAPT